MTKILIIDDDPDLVESMRIVLENKKYKVVSASSGQEGIDKVKEENPDLIILDVMMPNMDGFEVSRAIKGCPGNKNIPILMLTAIKEKTGLDFKKEAGDEVWLPVDDYCEKPLDHQELIAKIEKLVN